MPDNANYQAEQDQQPAICNISQKSVLVVEDDRSHRALMDGILQSCDFKTTHAENGLIALSKIDEGQVFDLIIMDWDMPELDGLETTKAIRLREQKQNKRQTPIIAFTAHRQPGDRQICLAAGMTAYLAKDALLPKWRQMLIDNLQGIIAGHFDLSDFEGATASPSQGTKAHDPDRFDNDIFVQTARLLKDDIAIAIEEYLEDAASYIRQIEQGMQNSDLEPITRGSHPLKSNSRGFGLSALADIAEEINTICEDKTSAEGNRIKAAKALLPKLQVAFSIGERNLKQALKSYLQ